MAATVSERWQLGLHALLAAGTEQAALDACVMVVADMLDLPAVGILRSRSEYLIGAAARGHERDLAPMLAQARRLIDPRFDAACRLDVARAEHSPSLQIIFREHEHVLGAICAWGRAEETGASSAFFELLQVAFVQTAQRLRQLAETRLLYELSLRLSSMLDLTDLLQEVLSLIAATFAAASSRLFLFDERAGDLLMSCGPTENRQSATSLRIPLVGTLAGQVVRDGEPCIHNIPVNDPAIDAGTESSDAGDKLICVPLKHSNRTLGALMLINQVDDPDFLDHDLRLLTTVGGTIAAMIANARLYQRAIRDALTGAYNRGAFDTILEECWAQWQANRRGFTLILLDLDDFKQINDRLGHLAGDQVLQQVTRLLWQALREDDTIFRYGGEEFGILLRGIVDVPTAAAIAERLRAALDHELAVNSLVRVRVSASFGVVIHPIHGASSPRELLDMADDAAYQAKRNGKNQVAIAAAPGLA